MHTPVVVPTRVLITAHLQRQKVVLIDERVGKFEARRHADSVEMRCSCETGIRSHCSLEVEDNTHDQNKC